MLDDELKADVAAAWKEAQQYGTMTEGPVLDPSTMFDDVYAEIPHHLESQRRRMLEVQEVNGNGAGNPRQERTTGGTSQLRSSDGSTSELRSS